MYLYMCSNKACPGHEGSAQPALDAPSTQPNTGPASVRFNETYTILDPKRS